MTSFRKSLTKFFNERALVKLDRSRCPIPNERIRKVPLTEREEYGNQLALVISLPNIPTDGTYIEKENAKDTGNKYRNYLDTREIPYEETIKTNETGLEYNEIAVIGIPNVHKLKGSLDRQGVEVEGYEYAKKTSHSGNDGIKAHEALIGAGVLSLILGGGSK